MGLVVLSFLVQVLLVQVGHNFILLFNWLFNDCFVFCFFWDWFNCFIFFLLAFFNNINNFHIICHIIMLEIMFYKCSIWNIYRISRVFFSMMGVKGGGQIAHLNHISLTLCLSHPLF